MNELSLDRATDWLLLVAAIVAAMVVFSLLARIVRATLGAVIAIALLVLGLQFFFGISASELVHDILRVWQGIWQKIAY